MTAQLPSNATAAGALRKFDALWRGPLEEMQARSLGAKLTEAAAAARKLTSPHDVLCRFLCCSHSLRPALAMSWTTLLMQHNMRCFPPRVQLLHAAAAWVPVVEALEALPKATAAAALTSTHDIAAAVRLLLLRVSLLVPSGCCGGSSLWWSPQPGRRTPRTC